MSARHRVLRAVALAAVALLALVAPVLAAGALPQTTSAGASPASRTLCGCPSLPVVAGSDKPAPGKAPFEIGFNELEWEFSNRASLHGGDWDQGFADIARVIDPDGSLGLARGPAPAVVADVPLVEGDMIKFILDGPPDPSTVPKDKLHPQGDTAFYYGSGAPLMYDLLITIARANKYGEPSFGIRAAAMRTAQFMVDDLATMPDAATSIVGSKAARLRQISDGASLILDLVVERVALPGKAMDIRLNAYGPMLAKLRAARLGGDDSAITGAGDAAKAGDLALDDNDLANAALDIVASVDDKGRFSGMFHMLGGTRFAASGYVTATQDQTIGGGDELLFRHLVELAAGSSSFGGAAASGSAQDVLGCKAFAALVKLADYHRPESAGLRARLASQLALMVASYAPLDATFLYTPSFKVARDVVLIAGLGDPDQAAQLSSALLQQAQMRGYSIDPDSYAPGHGAMEVFSTIRDIEQLATGPARYDFVLSNVNYFKQLQSFVDQQPPDSPIRAPRDFLEAWSRSAPDMSAPEARALCPPDEAPPQVLIYAMTSKGPALLDKLYQNIRLMLGAVFPEPYGDSSYPISIETSGGRLDLTAHATDDQRILFLTDQFTLH